jgi:hypothetical protein
MNCFFKSSLSYFCDLYYILFSVSFNFLLACCNLKAPYISANPIITGTPSSIGDPTKYGSPDGGQGGGSGGGGSAPKEIKEILKNKIIIRNLFIL